MAPPSGPGGIVRVPGADISFLDGARFGEGGIIRVEGGGLADPVLAGSGVFGLSGAPSLADIGANAPANAALSLLGDSPLSSVSGEPVGDPHADLTNPGVRGYYEGLLRLLGFNGAEVPTQIISVRQLNELRQACVGPDSEAVTVIIEDRQLAELLAQMDPDAVVTRVGDYPALNWEKALAAANQAAAIQAGTGGRPDTVFVNLANLPMAARAAAGPNPAAVRAVEDRAARMDLLSRVVTPIVRDEVRGRRADPDFAPVLRERIAATRLIGPGEEGSDPSGNSILRVTVNGDQAAAGRQLAEFERMINQGPLPEGFSGWEGMRASRDPANPNRLLVTRTIEFRESDGTTHQRDVTFFLEVNSL